MGLLRYDGVQLPPGPCETKKAILAILSILAMVSLVPGGELPLYWFTVI